jgi:hypothetical protein
LYYRSLKSHNGKDIGLDISLFEVDFASFVLTDIYLWVYENSYVFYSDTFLDMTSGSSGSMIIDKDTKKVVAVSLGWLLSSNFKYYILSLRCNIKY